MASRPDIYHSTREVCLLDFKKVPCIRRAYKIMVRHLDDLSYNSYLYNMFVKIWFCMVKGERFVLTDEDARMLGKLVEEIKTANECKVNAGDLSKLDEVKDVMLTDEIPVSAHDELPDRHLVDDTSDTSSDIVSENSSEYGENARFEMIKQILIEVFSSKTSTFKYQMLKTSALDGILATKVNMVREVVDIFVEDLNDLALDSIINNTSIDSKIINIAIDYLLLQLKIIENYLLTTREVLNARFTTYFVEELFAAMAGSQLMEEEMVFIFRKAFSIGVLCDEVVLNKIKETITADYLMIREELFAQIIIGIVKAIAVRFVFKSEMVHGLEHGKISREFMAVKTVDDILVFFDREDDSYSHSADIQDLTNALHMLFTTNGIKYFKEDTKLQICKSLHKFVRDDLIKKIKTALDYDEQKDLMDLLLVISLSSRKMSFPEYNGYFQAQIEKYYKERRFNDLKRVIDYYSTFVSTNGANNISYAFLKFDITWYKTFLILYFRKVKKSPELFDHVEAFFKFFVYTKSPILVDVFNSLPYIDKSHACLPEVYLFVHEIMCRRDCFMYDYKGSFERLMMPFLLKMPALFIESNHALIYHAEKLKLNNFNYTGVLEYLKDERTLSNDVVEVFKKIHRDVKLRSAFKEEYVDKLLQLAIENYYTSTDTIIMEILDILLKDNLCTEVLGEEDEGSASSSDRNSALSTQQAKLKKSITLLSRENRRKTLMGNNQAQQCAVDCVSEYFSYISDDQARMISNTNSLVLFGLFYDKYFHRNWLQIIERESKYTFLYQKIMYTLRITSPYYYTYLVLNSNFPIFYNFSLCCNLKHTLRINEKIMEFISSFPTNVPRNVQKIESCSSFFTSGSFHSIKEDGTCSVEQIRKDLRDIHGDLLNFVAEKPGQGGTNSFDEHQVDRKFEDNTSIHANKCLCSSSTRGSTITCSIHPTGAGKYDFFIDLVYVNQRNANVVGSAINFLLITIDEKFDLYLLYVILKIYKILKIHEPIVDDLLERAIDHVDYSIDIYAELADITDDFFKFYFFSAFNCVSGDTVESDLSLRKLPASKKEFVYNTFYLINNLHMTSERLAGALTYKGYILNLHDSIDIFTAIRVFDGSVNDGMDRLQSIDPFYVPQMVQLLRISKCFDVTAGKILELIEKDDYLSMLVYFNIRANFKNSGRVGKLLEKICNAKDFKDTVKFLDDLTRISSKMIKFKNLDRFDKKKMLDELLNEVAVGRNVILPLHGYKVLGIEQNSSRVLQSHAKVPFMATFVVEKDGVQKNVNLIFKAGDDCRQDQLALQLIQLFLSIFKESHLPIFLYPYRVISTDYECGIIEVITDAISRDQMGRERINNLSEYFGLKFGFKEGKEYQDAQRNFILSFVGYSLVSYFLNVKDRHNGNIMINGKGQMIHIDFGFMFDISPGGLNLEVPLKITEEIIELLNDHMDDYISLMIKGFFALRRRSKEIVLMAASFEQSQLPCFTEYAIDNLIARFKFHLSDAELKVHIRTLVHTSVRKFRTYIYDKFQALTNDISF
ncbi:atypical/PIKK protein kinase [Vavraia culicis subsp. floridensis]|uniref:1-phosphatidylinositol 4-kinase n=1 Tax=Vavraia culicis (isolate floridensis) TaxID=948595 RepID=L2GWF0_VAVCU|nr:atypical/PIKK protein kinase [Vavraia culicis subsp. floridensis]ELA47628.1 atypical/PIKK protein kinase [Vavraia culicis subsp. floridensis]